MNVDKKKYTQSQSNERPDTKMFLKQKEKQPPKKEVIFSHSVCILLFIQHLK